MDPLEGSLKAAEVTAKETGKNFLPRLNWLKGEEVWLMNLANNYIGQWVNHGTIVKMEKGGNPLRSFLNGERGPWPTFAKEYGVKMEEDALCCDKILQSILVDVNVFFSVNYNIETLKAIPRGEGACLRRLYKV